MKINWLKILRFFIVAFALYAAYWILSKASTLEEFLWLLLGVYIIYYAFKDDGSELREKLERARKSDQAKASYLNRK